MIGKIGPRKMPGRRLTRHGRRRRGSGRLVLKTLFAGFRRRLEMRRRRRDRSYLKRSDDTFDNADKPSRLPCRPSDEQAVDIFLCRELAAIG